MTEQRTPLGIVPDTNNRLQAMADDLQISLTQLIQTAERNGLEIVAKQARETGERASGHL